MPSCCKEGQTLRPLEGVAGGKLRHCLIPPFAGRTVRSGVVPVSTGAPATNAHPPAKALPSLDTATACDDDPCEIQGYCNTDVSNPIDPESTSDAATAACAPRS